MNTKRNILLKIPSILYGWVVGLRNILFDTEVLSSYQSEIPTICVGNLSVGGTGKTPHIDYLLHYLKSKYRVAVLTRGYGRKSSKPLIAQPGHTAADIGDEPMLFMLKHPGITIMVDGDRQRGLKRLEELPEDERPEVILMDDGFQHRQVKAAYNILLTPYHAPFTRDRLMPYGNLRESIHGKSRADTVIVTSTPNDLRPIDFRLMQGELDLFAHQDLYFSRVAYERPIRIFAGGGASTFGLQSPPLILLSGIANPSLFFNHCHTAYGDIVEELVFRDHHAFTKKDINHIIQLLEAHPEAYLLCTEKDAVRLYDVREQVPTEIKERLFALPIRIEISPEGQRRLRQRIEQAIKNNGLGL